MPSPFLGMDPYLEDPGLWPDVHHGLISEFQAELTRQIRPRYYVRVEDRVYLTDEAAYEAKRKEVKASRTHLVEVDLLRKGEPIYPRALLPPSDYVVYVSRVMPERRRSFAWPIRLPETLPVIGIPLRGDDPDAKLDLQAMLNSAYDRAGYDLTIDYSKPPVVPLDAESAEWAASILKGKESA